MLARARSAAAAAAAAAANDVGPAAMEGVLASRAAAKEEARSGGTAVEERLRRAGMAAKMLEAAMTSHPAA